MSKSNFERFKRFILLMIPLLSGICLWPPLDGELLFNATIEDQLLELPLVHTTMVPVKGLHFLLPTEEYLERFCVLSR